MCSVHASVSNSRLHHQRPAALSIPAARQIRGAANAAAATPAHITPLCSSSRPRQVANALQVPACVHKVAARKGKRSTLRAQAAATAEKVATNGNGTAHNNGAGTKVMIVGECLH